VNGPVQNAFAEAFRELRSAFGVSMTLGTTKVVAVVGESLIGRELVEGGFQFDADFVARVLLADLPKTPAIGDAVTYQGQPFRISHLAIKPGHPVAEISLRSAKR
jgi:hypothetical protein